MKKLVIFDVCNTIVDTNSTFSYVDFLIKRWVKSKYNILFHNKFLRYCYFIIYLIFHFDCKITFTKIYFKQLDVKKIKLLSWEYFERYENKIFPDMLKIINNEKKSFKVILLSSSINPPIDFLKKKLWIEWFSSTLEEKDGKYTWKILQPLWWKKEIVFEKQLFNLKDYREINYYTDNHNDTNLIKYLKEKNNNLKIYIKSYWNKKYWDNFFSNNKIKYEYLD